MRHFPHESGHDPSEQQRCAILIAHESCFRNFLRLAGAQTSRRYAGLSEVNATTQWGKTDPPESLSRGEHVVLPGRGRALCLERVSAGGRRESGTMARPKRGPPPMPA
jgi:hypothetical protein